MTIIRCPRCRDEVSVPQGATSRALVRCPLCLEQYLLSEALNNAPPALVIIGGEVEQAAIVSPAADEEYRLTGSQGPSAAYQAAAAGSPTTAAVRPAVRTAPRPRPRQGNPLLLLINYVGGGVMGLALGLLVLWWGFQRDPLELGPTFAAYTPWIVPVQFRGKPAADPASGMQATELSASSSRTKKPPPPLDEPLQSLPTYGTLDQVPGAALSPTIEEPLLSDPTPAAPSSDIPPPNVVDPASATSEEAVSTSSAAMPDLVALLPDDWPSRVPPRENQRAFLEAVELTDAINRAGQSLTQYQNASGSDETRRETFVQLHADLSEAGRLLSYREPGQTGLSQPIGEIEKLLEQIVASQPALEQLKALTHEHWPDIPDGRGFFVVGTVKGTQPAGDLYTISLTLDGDRKLPVAITTNPEDLCQPSDQLLVIGRIVEEPKVNLPGYDGGLPKLLKSGFVVRAAKPE
jgi:hypothetical protein